MRNTSCQGDADVLIVETTVPSAVSCETTLVGDDTDMLVLLCFHAKEDSCEVFFKSEIRSGTKKSPRCWNIKMPSSAAIQLLRYSAREKDSLLNTFVLTTTS